MKTFTFTNGRKEVKTYNEVSNNKQGCYNNNEILRTVKTDKVSEIENETYDTRFELV